ncbi:universal stress protein [Lactobacillus sp. PV037]|uniref:universal stress protein n=1 Tax=Lactobacillus sp. PV037 TaxID=2594496 RepID=UPI002240D3BF|nr:universal stress protein [Lactobacillus sp. PV037]QNQ84229.1 universal stress protein [Lactobacillus sp. PV037]
MEDYNNILVPVDGSETSERAFDKAVKIAIDNNAHLDLLNVIDTRQFMGEMQDTLVSGDTIYQMTQDSEKYLESLKQWAKETFDFTDIAIHIRYGSPKRIIAIDFIQDHGNDLTIMGATGMNALERMLMGSVTAYVNQHSLSDVLIAKTDMDNQKVAKKKRKLFK